MRCSVYAASVAADDATSALVYRKLRSLRGVISGLAPHRGSFFSRHGAAFRTFQYIDGRYFNVEILRVNADIISSNTKLVSGIRPMADWKDFPR